MEPAQGKESLMDCEACSELLADFLLDELPSSEALLVHEHLLLCPACMKAYRELKGTGKALEAVTVMQPVQGSKIFKQDVLAQAQIESEKIVAKLPPERRLRLEARREARQSIRLLAVKKQPVKVWSPGLLILALSGAAILTGILLWPRGGERATTRAAIGTLSIVMGKVEQFYVTANHPHTPVAEGKGVLAGDAFTTGDAGRARIDLHDGSSILLGPACDATFRLIPEQPDDLVLQIDSGEFCIERADADAAGGVGKNAVWEVRTDAGYLQFAPATRACARIAGKGKTSELDVSVLSGCVHAFLKDGKMSEPLYAGQRTALRTFSSFITVESLSDERPPAWRADLVSEADLAALLGAKARIVQRKPGAVLVELDYKNQLKGRDWHPEPEPEDSAMLARSVLSEINGVFKCPSGIRLRHAAKFAPPVSLELKLNSESRRNTSFAFGLLENAGNVVAVDVTHEATLSVQEKGKFPRRDRLAARVQPGNADVLLLEIKPEGAGFAATLNSASGKTKSVPVWKERADLPGDVWIQALGDGILFDEIKLTGLLSPDWLREKLNGNQ